MDIRKKGKIAVVAGTLVDAQMGVTLLENHGMAGTAFPLTENPRRQMEFQLMPSEEKLTAVRRVLAAAVKQGCCRVLVYCNSLSGAVDFPVLEAEMGLRIVTPMDTYHGIARQYQRIGVIAANAQGLSGIERILYAANPEIELLEGGLLTVVEGIEAGESPEKLVERFRLAELAAWFRGCGAQALLLGCTHFPYFKAALEKRTELPILEPSEGMVRLITEDYVLRHEAV